MGCFMLRMVSCSCVVLLSIGCASEKGGDDTGGRSPCGDGTWGDLTAPTSAIHVRADGDDAADGSLDAPVATLEAALTLSRARSSDKTIFVGPGTYSVTELTITDDAGDGATDDGLTIDACADEVTLEAGDDGSPVVRVSAASDVTLARLDLVGGTRSLFIWNGAIVTLHKINIKEGRYAGLVIGGHETLVGGEHNSVSDTSGSSDDLGAEAEGGFGIGISGATVNFTQTFVRNARVAGVFVDSDARDGGVAFEDLTVEGTSADAEGRYGRGVHAQDVASLTLTDCTLTDNQDAGVFVLQASEVSLIGVAVDATAAGVVPDSDETSGDGIVITSVDETGDLFNPADFDATLDGNTVTTAARAGILLEGVEATADGNSASGDGEDLVMQGDAIVTGADSTDFTDLNASPLGINRVALDGAGITP